MRAICCSFCGVREGLEADRTAELIAAKELSHFICIYCLKLFLKACQKREIIDQTCEGSTIAEKNLHCSFCLHPPKEDYFFTNNRDSYICESCLVRANQTTDFFLNDAKFIHEIAQLCEARRIEAMNYEDNPEKIQKLENFEMAYNILNKVLSDKVAEVYDLPYPQKVATGINFINYAKAKLNGLFAFELDEMKQEFLGSLSYTKALHTELLRYTLKMHIRSWEEEKKKERLPEIDEYDEEMCEEIDMISSQENEPSPEQEFLSHLPHPNEIKEHLDQYVIGQDGVKKTLAVAVYNHYLRLKMQHNDKHANDVRIDKSNILLIGPTGSGKTFLAQTLAKALNVPFAISDATTLTEAGYNGNDVESVIQKLFAQCDGDYKKAEWGIIYIDEVDKLSGNRLEGEKIAHDVYQEGVQHALLKLMEGTIAEVPIDKGRKTSSSSEVSIDTKNILFILGGAFSGLEKIIQKRLAKQDAKSTIGFTADVDDPHQLRHRKENSALEASSEVLSQVSAQDLARFGLVPEFIGRIPIISVLSPLDEEALINILTTPKNAIIKQFQKLFQYNGAELEFDDTALQAIAKRALKQQTGARGLRSIIEHLLLDIMYELPEKAIKKVVITGRTVEDGTPPLIDYHKQDQIIANNEAPPSRMHLSAEEIRKFQSIFE